MDNLNDIKMLWHNADTNRLPSAGEMLRMVKKFRTQKLRSKWLVITASIVLAGIMVMALVIGQFNMASTYIGGALMAGSSLLLAATNIRSLKRFYQLADCSNLEFLAFIEQTRQNQRYYYQKTMLAIVALLLSGWLLYLYEVVHRHGGWMIVLYVGILVYLCLAWFYIRPRAFKKNAEKLNQMQARLQRITNQLK